MMGETTIEWTDATENVFVVAGEDGSQNGWYCERVSEGCQHCYAERLNGTSFYGGNGLPYRQSREGRPPLMIRREIMAGWVKKTKPKKRFINSMTDTFGEFIPDEWIFDLFDAMVAAPMQTFQVLTKRAERMCHVTTAWLAARGLDEVPAHIWMMVSVENQARADERIHWLLRTRAAVHGLSCEPLLGKILLDDGCNSWLSCRSDSPEYPEDDSNYEECCESYAVGGSHFHGIDWVIVGGESGPNARPMRLDWVRDIRDQCKEARVPFLFKQWGEYVPHGQAPNISTRGGVFHTWSNYPFDWSKKVGKHAAGRLLDGRTWDEFPLVEFQSA